MDIVTYLLENLGFYALTAVTLLLWDTIDLYIELRDFHFLASRSFGAYYSIRAFFSVAVMEIAIVLGLLKAESKAIIAFVVPLTFAIVLDNLILEVGGQGGKSIDFSQIFDRFRFAILTSFKRKGEETKVRNEMKLLDSSVTDAQLLENCRLYSSPEEMNNLTKSIASLEPSAKRLELIKCLVNKAETKAINEFLKRSSRQFPKKQPPGPKA